MRQHRKEYIQFLSIALGSIGELETQLLIAKDIKAISLEDYESAETLLNNTGGMLTNLIRALRKKGPQAPAFTRPKTLDSRPD